MANNLPEPIPAALAYNLPMYWMPTAYTHTLELHVITALYENNNVRVRKVRRIFDMRRALRMSVTLYQHGANLSIANLMDVDPWLYGWEPELTTLTNQVRDLARNRNARPIDWDGYAASKVKRLVLP